MIFETPYVYWTPAGFADRPFALTSGRFTVASGGTLLAQPIIMDSDADLHVRSIRSFTVGLGRLEMRLRDSEDEFLTSDWLGVTALADGVLRGTPLPTELLIPANGKLQVDLREVSAGGSASVEFVFSGVKRFRL